MYLTVMYIVFSVCINTFIFAQDKDNVFCQLDDGQIGYCTDIRNCPFVINRLRSRKYSTNCGFNGRIPIVCCIQNITKRAGEEIVGTVARKKCDEYRNGSIATTTTTDTTVLSVSKAYVVGVIGGRNASLLEFPHMAVLGYGRSENIEWRCGGSLISDKFVLTAAHCINSRGQQVKRIKLGVHELSFSTFNEQIFGVKKVFKHPSYRSSQCYHDIALIQLDHPANILSRVKPGCIHTSMDLPGDALIATGWGVVEVLGDMYDILQKVNLSYVPVDTCALYYKKQRRLNNGIMGNSQLCAFGFGKKPGDTCQGDSGGPLQYKFDDANMYTIIGITSFGMKCGIVPGVYTRVSNYVPWIESIVWPEEAATN